MIGTIVGNRYKIIAELGSGGMAWVYLAHDLREDRRVAIKILYPQYSQDLAFLQRFMQEAKLAMALSHPHIVRVLDYGSDRDTHYLVMEFVPGHDLGQILEERGPLPWQEALHIARQVAQALAHANQHGIVHRDIKPGNIMVLPDGSVRVLDFGIARAKTSPELTLSGFVGSPNYAAPEQAMGEAVDIRADLYSLGIVLYRMLSGRLPFEGETPWAVVNQHIATPPPPLERDDLPEAVATLVNKALAKRPDDRFQTPEEMIRAIEAVLAGHELPFEEQTTETTDLDNLYHQAQAAVKAGAWQRAVDLFSRILKTDPDYRDVNEQLTHIGNQVRLESLYRAARQSLHQEQWDIALRQIEQIAEIDPSYRDIDTLRTLAEKQEAFPGGGAEGSEFPTQVHTTPPPFPPDAEKEKRTTRRAPWLLIGVLAAVVIGSVVLLLRPGPAPVAVATATATATVQPSPTASPTTLPTADRRPTATPEATPTTAIAPSPGPTASATATATATATPSPTPTPTATRPPVMQGQIAFPRFDAERGTYDVFICRVDGRNCRRVLTEASQPDFLPDGSQLVVHSWKADDKGLWLISSEGERIWKITDTIEAARPSVDFQGKIYVYHSRQVTDRQPRLYRTYGAETRPLRREGNPILGLAPSWLPDGRILYSGCLGNTCGIIVMRADGSAPRQIVAGSSETNPESSPDGRQLAFMSRRDGNWEIYVADLDGSGLRRLTHHPANDGLPTWSPDGKYLAFVSDRDGQWAIWVLPAGGGGEPRKLFAIGGPLDGRVRGAAPHETHGWVEERISWSP